MENYAVAELHESCFPHGEREEVYWHDIVAKRYNIIRGEGSK
jgi:hypothetical protein